MEGATDVLVITAWPLVSRVPRGRCATRRGRGARGGERTTQPVSDGDGEVLNFCMGTSSKSTFSTLIFCSQQVRSKQLHGQRVHLLPNPGGPRHHASPLHSRDTPLQPAACGELPSPFLSASSPLTPPILLLLLLCPHFTPCRHERGRVGKRGGGANKKAVGKYVAGEEVGWEGGRGYCVSRLRQEKIR